MYEMAKKEVDLKKQEISDEKQVQTVKEPEIQFVTKPKKKKNKMTKKQLKELKEKKRDEMN